MNYSLTFDSCYAWPPKNTKTGEEMGENHPGQGRGRELAEGGMDLPGAKRREISFGFLIFPMDFSFGLMDNKGKYIQPKRGSIQIFT